MKKIMFMLALVACLMKLSCCKEQINKPAIKNLSNNVTIKRNEVAYNAFGGKTYLHSLIIASINNNTTEDFQWESTRTTFPVQDYPSNHNELRKQTVMTNLLNDYFTIISLAALPENIARSFTRFRLAAKENAGSSIRGGELAIISVLSTMRDRN